MIWTGAWAAFKPGIMLAKWREIKRMAWDLFECNGINIKYALL